MLPQPVRTLALLAPLSLFAACGDSDGRGDVATAQSCMTCHNGSLHNDYAGPGLENPHPFGVADNLLCTTCHGGDPDGLERVASMLRETFGKDRVDSCVLDVTSEVSVDAAFAQCMRRFGGVDIVVLRFLQTFSDNLLEQSRSHVHALCAAVAAVCAV